MASITELKLNSKVKIVQNIDSSNPAQRIGESGKITQIGDVVSLDMVTVQFPDGFEDGYWPEELELLL